MQTAINQENIGRLNSLPGEPTSSPASPRDDVARGAGIVQHAPSHVKGYQRLDRAPCRGIERETSHDIKQLGVARVPIHSRVTKEKTIPKTASVGLLTGKSKHQKNIEANPELHLFAFSDLQSLTSVILFFFFQ